LRIGTGGDGLILLGPAWRCKDGRLVLVPGLCPGTHCLAGSACSSGPWRLGGGGLCPRRGRPARGGASKTARSRAGARERGGDPLARPASIGYNKRHGKSRHGQRPQRRPALPAGRLQHDHRAPTRRGHLPRVAGRQSPPRQDRVRGGCLLRRGRRQQQRHLRQRPPHRRPGALGRPRHAADRPLRAQPGPRPGVQPRRARPGHPRPRRRPAVQPHPLRPGPGAQAPGHAPDRPRPRPLPRPRPAADAPARPPAEAVPPGRPRHGAHL
jgi:hypothetical protein